ncbi:hypothetical protein HNP46_000419 [Pseudomonas nitritireducens]|uniref:Uncharacterized protein n=1 Tax=Pseudomonas nitroreducens TaxID=46680 RepID=A0A7W7NYE1_PSENT|nr:hypothetical protein [Pseudomonas nitritireducens]MBB4861608.1 hypothetical protein [Pseudomonas nitritireducens]
MAVSRRKPKSVEPTPVSMINWTRADPEALAKFDPKSKVCNMNCGKAGGDPRCYKELLFLCHDC